MASDGQQPYTDHPLLVWGLATLHASLLVSLLVIGLYRVGGLGDALEGIGAPIGLAVYGMLWLISWWATRRALRGVAWATLNRPLASPTLLLRGLVWGAVSGAVFFLLLLLAIPALRIQAGADLNLLSVLLGLGFLLLLGLPFALVLGGLVGVLFSIVDSAGLAIAQRICPGDPGE